MNDLSKQRKACIDTESVAQGLRSPDVGERRNGEKVVCENPKCRKSTTLKVDGTYRVHTYLAWAGGRYGITEGIRCPLSGTRYGGEK